MIYINEWQESVNLWQMARKCREQYCKYILEADEAEVERRYITECCGEDEQREPRKRKTLALIWWGLSLASSFKAMQMDTRFAADFSSNESGYQHFADALAALPEDDGLIYSNCVILEQADQRCETPAQEPFILETLLQKAVQQGNRYVLEKLPEAQRKRIQSAYFRLWHIEDVKRYINAGYRACQIFDRNREERKRIGEALSNPDTSIASIKVLYGRLFRLYSDLRESSGWKTPDRFRKHLKLDIFDHQISYLERIARAEEVRLDKREKVVLIPPELKGLIPETILLANLLYRQLCRCNGNAYSDDYWSIPGHYQSVLGIYGRHTMAPDHFFKRVMKEWIAIGAANHPIEDFIVISGHYMVKLARSAWKAFIRAEALYDSNESVQISILEPEVSESPLSLKDSWHKYEAYDNSHPTLQDSSTVLEGKSLYTQDNGGNRAFEAIYALQRQEHPREKTDNNDPFILIRDAFWRKNDQPSNLEATSALIVPFLIQTAAQDDMFPLEKKPLSLLSNNKAWQKLSFRLLVCFLCWRREERAGKRSINLSLDSMEALAAEAESAFLQELSAFRKDINDNNYIASSTGRLPNNSVCLTLDRTTIHGESLRDWLFSDGEMPIWTETIVAEFHADVQDAVARFLNSGKGIDHEAFNRKSFKKVTQFDVLLRLLIGYALEVTAADHLILRPMESGEFIFVPIYRPFDVVSSQEKGRTFKQLCDDIIANTADFDSFLVSTAPRGGVWSTGTTDIWLKVVRYMPNDNKNGKTDKYHEIELEIECLGDPYCIQASGNQQVLYKCWNGYETRGISKR